MVSSAKRLNGHRLALRPLASPWRTSLRLVSSPHVMKPPRSSERLRRCGPKAFWGGGYGATVARLTPDQKVGSSNLSALIFVVSIMGVVLRTSLPSVLSWPRNVDKVQARQAATVMHARSCGISTRGLVAMTSA